MSRFFFIFLLFLCSSSATWARWDEKYYNPKPMQDDVIIPLPCDGAMVFRKVAIPVDGPLGDKRLVLGSTSGGPGYLEGTRTEWLAGGFRDSPVQTYFLMARYETSVLQYQSVMGSNCPVPGPQGRLPQGFVGWFDALSFTEKLTTWLRKTQSDSLPRQGDEAGFIRLPTETEWEYAARGGASVSPADFNEPVFPIKESLSRHAWYAGTQSANGKPQFVGLLEPGPLGLHDMLGNLDEIVLDPFHFVRPGRYHGQPGGFVVRGGHYMTAEADIRTSLRSEIPFFDASGPRRAATTGFRVVISVPALTSRAAVKSVQEAWNHLGSEAGGDEYGAEPRGKTPSADLSLLAGTVADPALERRLRAIGDRLKADLAARDEARDRAVRTTLRMGAFLGQKLSDDGKWVAQLESIWKSQHNSDPEGERTSSYRQQLDDNTAALQDNLRYYADTVVRTAEEYDDATLSRQKSILVAEMMNLGLSYLLPYIDRHLSHVLVYRTNQQIRRKAWLEDFVKL